MKKLSLVLMAVLAFAFTGCGDWLDIPDPNETEAKITLHTPSATLKSGETFQIVAECENPIAYRSENEYYATVSESGLVTAGFVGSTSISLVSAYDTQAFEVMVEPVSNLYPEPEIVFGESRESVIARLGTPSEADEGAILYAGYTENSAMLMVTFDENNLVQYYGVFLDIAYTADLATFLGERYLYVKEEDGVMIYINALDVNSATLVIGSEVLNEEGLVMAVYSGKGGAVGDHGVDKAARVFKTLKRLAK